MGFYKNVCPGDINLKAVKLDGVIPCGGIIELNTRIATLLNLMVYPKKAVIPVDAPVEDTAPAEDETPETALTRQQLMAIAKERGIPYKSTDTRAILYSKVFGDAE